MLLFWYFSKQAQLHLSVTFITVEQINVLTGPVKDAETTSIWLRVILVIIVMVVQLLVLIVMDMRSVLGAIQAITDLFAKLYVQAAKTASATKIPVPVHMAAFTVTTVK